MSYTVDVDIGGTLTDGLISDGRRAEVVKVDTTPHDFTVCFFDCLEEGARRFGEPDLQRFLRHVDVVRWSSTIATNVVAQRQGPRIGLLVNREPKENLYGAHPSPAVDFLIAPQHIAVVDVADGREAILLAVRSLLESGVRRVCVSFASDHDQEATAAERKVKAWIEEQYPDHYLGSVPVLLGNDMLRHPDAQTRTHMALMNAYVHTPLATSLFKAEDRLLALGYRRPVYIGHVNGGVARVAKTKGVDTTESGPVFGLDASAHFAKLYSSDRVISLDVGGTTTKLGAIQAGRPALSERGDLFGIPLQVPWVLLRSAALGGGSVARVQQARVTLGPDSMGAYPGPACYELGSEEPTLTDALLHAGMIDPDRFLGGRRRLSTSLAAEALEKRIAHPLGVDVDAAAALVLQRAVEIIGETAAQLGGSSSAPDLFCFGGNGANLAVPVAARLASRRAVVFRMGPVFSALGSALSAVRHLEERWPRLALDGDAAVDQLAGWLAEDRDRIAHDMSGEGLQTIAAGITSELVLSGEGEGQAVPVTADEEGSYRVAVARLAKTDGSAPVVERVTTTGVGDVVTYQPPEESAASHEPEATGTRSVLVGAHRVDAHVYDWDLLTPGAHLEGPAVLDGAVNSCTVPGDWQLDVDGYSNGLLTRSQGEAGKGAR